MANTSALAVSIGAYAPLLIFHSQAMTYLSFVRMREYHVLPLLARIGPL